MVTVEIYSRPDCCLCDEAKRVLARVRADHPFELREIDLRENPDLEAAYGEQIPVIFVGGFKAFKYRVDETELRSKLARAAERTSP
jgi:glutaredoxin